MLAEATTAAQSTHSEVLAALRQASVATGSDFDYLLGTAMRESSLKPQAKSSASSAAGLFQFVSQTWLGMIKQYGAKHGLGSYANAIEKAPDGRYHADNQSDRQAILALRNDPRVSALMAGEYASQTKDQLESRLGRDVCGGELYAAHFLGPGAACHLIELNNSNPAANAAACFPTAADANRNVFFHHDGTAKTVREVYNWTLQQPKVSAQALARADVTPQAHQVALSIPPLSPATSMLPVAAASRADDWSTLSLFTGGAGALPLLGAALPQPPFALSSDVVGILASLTPEHRSESDEQNAV